MFTIIIGNQVYTFPTEKDFVDFTAMLFRFSADRKNLYMELVGNGGAYFNETVTESDSMVQDTRQSVHQGMLYLHKMYGKIYDPEEQYLDLTHRAE